MASWGGDTDRLSDKTFDSLCTMCKHDGRNTEAVKYCTYCTDYYCLKCVKVHDTVLVSKGHKVVDKGQFQKGSSKPLPMVPTERCDRHGLKYVDMYCENHDSVGCSTCITVEHRLCQDIFYIPEYIQNNGTCNPKDIQRKLDSTKKTLAENLRHFEQEKQHAMKRKTESIQSVRKFRHEVNKRLGQLEQACVAEIEKKYKVLISKIEEEIRLITETKSEVSSAQDKLASAGNNVSQVFVSTKMGHIVTMHAAQCIEGRSTRSQKEDISFIPDQKLSEVLNKLKVLGDVVQQFSRKGEEKRKDSVKQKDALLQIKGMKKYPVKVQSDSKACDIISSCALDDGSIVLADRRNKKLKRLDISTYSVRDHYDLPGQPWQVCAINDQKVAVSYHKQEIMFISLGNRMTQKSLTKTDFNCYGLAYANDNLYISDSRTSVYIYSVSGSKLKQLSKDQSGQPLFPGERYLTTIYSLAVSVDGSKIYVANAGEGLIVLDTNGQLVREFNDSKLKYAYDVHLTSSGNILVCGMDSNNVLQFGNSGDLLGEVLKSVEGQKGCETICCNQLMTKMIVGREKNEIEVYDFVL